MPLAVFLFEFDPTTLVDGIAIRLETAGIAFALFVGLGSAAVIARGFARGGRPAPALDLLLLAIAATPGALVGGRIGYALLHLDYYEANPLRLLDPSTGGFQLGLAIVGGVATAGLFALTLGGRVRTWLQVAALPLLAMLGLAKLATALGGSGQGAPWGGPFATAYLGAGPWGSLDPGTPAWPSQLIEGLFVLVGAAILVVLIAPEATPTPEGRRRAGRPSVADRTAGRTALAPADRDRPLTIAGGSPTVPDGRAFFIALWVWATARLFAAFTWRDAPVLGPLRADQLISLGIATGSAFLFVVYVRGGIRFPRLPRFSRSGRPAEAALVAHPAGLELPAPVALAGEAPALETQLPASGSSGQEPPPKPRRTRKSAPAGDAAPAKRRSSAGAAGGTRPAGPNARRSKKGPPADRS